MRNCDCLKPYCACEDQPRCDVPFELGVVHFGDLAMQTVPFRHLNVGLCRHAIGDWGHIDDQLWEENEQALRNGGRICSAYDTEPGPRFWVITEHDRSRTTVLMPLEY